MNALYRLQISEKFTFDQAIRYLDYLEDLGFDGLYLSPFYEACSEHGYDITNPNKASDKVGDFDAFCQEAHRRGMQIVIDVVPNHMGFVNGQNAWFEDVLQNGQKSPFAHFFDIDWSQGKLTLPFLDEDQVIEKEHYRLVHWSKEINYRRFFNIKELIAVSIEHEDVLQAHHKWLFELMQKGQIDGLRIDHPDGLLNPALYLQRLRQKKDIYTVVEKILEPGEELPNWDVEGTVGYEYLNLLNGLFVEKKHEKAFTTFYEELCGPQDFHQTLLEAKREFARKSMMSEINRLSRASNCSADALIEVIACFPVYRTYVVDKPSKTDTQVINQALAEAKKNRPDLNFHRLEKLLIKPPFALKFQQVTGPMMAKGLEDTTFYRYNRFISLNEVGGDPSQFGVSTSQFHEQMKKKRQKWPLGLFATSTHDTKRSEDARMRLNVISEIPHEWEALVQSWWKLDSSIDANTAYHIYQTLIAGWPKEGPRWPDFFERMWQVVLKSIREAKQHTDWAEPNEKYESRVHTFLQKMLTPNSLFLKSFVPFFEKIEPFAEKSMLAALAIKVACPAVLDTYQGNETWNFRLVDPDNRTLFRPAEDSSKRAFLRKLLRFRRDHQELFLEGEYIPLESSHNTIAFVRRTKKEELLVIAGRFFASNPDFGTLDYFRQLENPFTEKMFGSKEGIDVEEVLEGEPAVLLYGKNKEADF